MGWILGSATAPTPPVRPRLRNPHHNIPPLRASRMIFEQEQGPRPHFSVCNCTRSSLLPYIHSHTSCCPPARKACTRPRASWCRSKALVQVRLFLMDEKEKTGWFVEEFCFKKIDLQLEEWNLRPLRLPGRTHVNPLGGVGWLPW